MTPTPRHEITVGNDVVARVAVAPTLSHHWVLAEVDAPSPARNDSPDSNLAFKSGDALDMLQDRTE